MNDSSTIEKTILYRNLNFYHYLEKMVVMKIFLLDICRSHSWSRSWLQLQPQSKSLAPGDSGSATLLTASWVSSEKRFWGFCKKEIWIF